MPCEACHGAERDRRKYYRFDTERGALYDECVLFDEDNGVALGKEPGSAMAKALANRSCMVLKTMGF